MKRLAVMTLLLAFLALLAFIGTPLNSSQAQTQPAAPDAQNNICSMYPSFPAGSNPKVLLNQSANAPQGVEIQECRIWISSMYDSGGPLMGIGWGVFSFLDQHRSAEDAKANADHWGSQHPNKQPYDIGDAGWEEFKPAPYCPESVECKYTVGFVRGCFYAQAEIGLRTGYPSPASELPVEQRVEALRNIARQLDQNLKTTGGCPGAVASRATSPPVSPPMPQGETPPSGRTPPAPVIGVTSPPLAPGGTPEGIDLGPWIPLAATLLGGLLANLLGRATGRAMNRAEGSQDNQPSSDAPLATAQPPVDTMGYRTQPGAATNPDGDLPPIPFPSDDLPPIPPDNGSQDQPAKDKVYHVTLVSSGDSIRGDGMDTAALLPRVFSSDGADVTAKSTFTFEKFTDIGDQAAVLSSGGPAATLFSRLLLSGEPQPVTVCCHATVNTPTGPITVDSERVTVCVRAANLQFTLDLPQDGGFGSGEGAIAVNTALTVFGEARGDYAVTFSCTPMPASGVFSKGPGRATAFPVPKLVVANKTYTVSANGVYNIGGSDVPIKGEKSVTFTSLAPELCITPSKNEVIGDGQDSTALAITGTFCANGQAFKPLAISVEPPRLGSCPSPAAGTTSTSFVAPLLDGAQDEDVAIAARAKYAGDDGEVTLTGQTVITVLALAPQLSIETVPDDGYALANGGNQIILKAVLRIRGQLQPATETTWEIAPTVVEGESRCYGALEGGGATVPYRVPLLVATAWLSQKITANYRGNGLNLHAEATLALEGMQPKIEVRFAPEDIDEVHADGKRRDVVAEAYWEGYEEGEARTQFLLTNLQYRLHVGDGSVTKNDECGSVTKKDEWVGSYQSPDGGSDPHDDVKLVVRASGRVVGDDAPAPGIEIRGDLRFTLRYPNPRCEVDVSPGTLVANGKSVAKVTVRPTVYGAEAQSLGAQIAGASFPLNMAQLAQISAFDRTTLCAKLVLGTWPESIDLAVPAIVDVDLEDHHYQCSGAGSLKVIGKRSPRLVLSYQVEDSKGISRADAVGDSKCLVKVTASLADAGPDTTLSNVSFTASLAGVSITPDPVDTTSVRIPLGLLLKDSELKIKAEGTTSPAADTALTNSLTIPVFKSRLQIENNETDFDLFCVGSRWQDNTAQSVDSGPDIVQVGQQQAWRGAITCTLTTSADGQTIGISGRDIGINIRAEALDSASDDISSSGDPLPVRDFGKGSTDESGAVKRALSYDDLITALSKWTRRPRAIVLRIVAKASDDYGSSVVQDRVLTMRLPKLLTLSIPDRILEHVGDKVLLSDPDAPGGVPGPDQEQFPAPLLEYKWRILARNDQEKFGLFDIQQTQAHRRPVLDLRCESLDTRYALHNLPLDFRWIDDDDQSTAAADLLEPDSKKKLYLRPLAERENSKGDIVATSSRELTFWRLVWPKDPIGVAGTVPINEFSYHFRQPIVFIHGTIGSELMRERDVVWPTVDLGTAPKYTDDPFYADFIATVILGDPKFAKVEGRTAFEFFFTPEEWQGVIEAAVRPQKKGLPVGKELSTTSGEEFDQPKSSDGVRVTSVLRYVAPDHECYLGWLRLYEELQYAPAGSVTGIWTPARPSRALRLIAYDFRLDNRKHVQRMSKFITDLLNSYYGEDATKFKTRPRDRRVIIMAHSMGGLISRYFAATHRDEYENNVECLVTLGTPHRGAADPLMASLGGQQNPGGIMDRLLNMFPAAAIEMCDRMPSNFQLLAFDRPCFFVKTQYGDCSEPLRFWEVEPMILKMYPEFFRKVLAEVTAELEAQRRSLGKRAYLFLPSDPRTMIVPTPEMLTHVWKAPELIADSVQFHREIGDSVPPRTIQFAGNNREDTTDTISVILATKLHLVKAKPPAGVHPDPQEFDDAREVFLKCRELRYKFDWTLTKGDGTVPGWGLQAAGCRRLYSVKLSDSVTSSDFVSSGNIVHRTLGSDPVIQDALKKIIRGILPPGNTLP